MWFRERIETVVIGVLLYVGLYLFWVIIGEYMQKK